MIQAIKTWLVVSVVTVVASCAIIIGVRPLLGIDFTGGSLLVVTAPLSSSDSITKIFSDEFQRTATLQAAEEGTLLIRTDPLDEADHQRIIQRLVDDRLITEELRFESVGPTIGSELQRKALYATALSVFLMIVYLAYVFRGTSRAIAPWKFGVAATYALIHDVLVVSALFVILGTTHSVPIDTLFVTAMLSVFGYSANDTIVIFNRFKQEWLASRGADLLTVMDTAVQRSTIRSLNITLPILLTLTSLLLFGGSTLRWFIIALTAGTIVGSYSSFFVAPPLLYFLARQR